MRYIYSPSERESHYSNFSPSTGAADSTHQGTTPEGLADIRLCIVAFREQLRVFQMVKADARDMAKQLEKLDSFR